MRNRPFTEIMAALSACAAWAAISFSTSEFTPRIDRKLHQATGRALAFEALGILKPGGRITLITRDTATFPQPAMDILLDSFTREIRRAGAVVASTHFVQVDPLRPVEVPPGDFFELIRRASAEHVIVSFMGPPLLSEEQRNQLGRVKPKIVAFCSGNLAENIDLSRLFDAGLLHAAVVSRRGSSAAGDTPRKIPEAFDDLYTTVTARDLSKLPAHLGAAQ